MVSAGTPHAGAPQPRPPTARHLQIQSKERELRRRMAFAEIEAQLYARIRSKASADWRRLVYAVPKFIVGLPPYSPPECAAYLAEALRAVGYLVEVYGIVLYISWDREEQRKASREGQQQQQQQQAWQQAAWQQRGAATARAGRRQVGER